MSEKPLYFVVIVGTHWDLTSQRSTCSMQLCRCHSDRRIKRSKPAFSRPVYKTVNKKNRSTSLSRSMPLPADSKSRHWQVIKSIGTSSASSLPKRNLLHRLRQKQRPTRPQRRTAGILPKQLSCAHAMDRPCSSKSIHLINYPLIYSPHCPPYGRRTFLTALFSRTPSLAGWLLNIVHTNSRLSETESAS